MPSLLDPLRVGWCPLGIQSPGLLGVPLCPCLIVGTKLVARGESSANEWLNLFENSRAFSVLPVVTTLHLTVRRRWKVIDTGLWPPRFPLGITKAWLRSKAWLLCWILYG